MLAAVRGGGVVVLHLLNLWRLPDGPCVWQKCKRATLERGDVLIVKGVHRTGSGGYLDLVIVPLDASPSMQTESVPILGIEAEKLDQTLRKAGASSVQVLGNYQEQPYSRDSSVDLIVVATSGRVIINGTLVLDGPHAQTNLRAFRRKHIGFVFQKSNLIPFLTAIENVQIALELNDLRPSRARTRAHELLGNLGVSDRAGNLPSMLSGGQQQRVAVARALANQPSVILAGEPTAALDSHRGRQVMELFAQVARDHGAGVIVVTHDHRALVVFDTIYEMEDGAVERAANGRTKVTHQ